VEIPFPITVDLSMQIAKQYGMIQQATSNTSTVRAVFIIDPRGIVRAINYYPLEVGRSTEEILRLVKALQTADRFEVGTPANWQPGEPVVVPPPSTYQQLIRRVENPPSDWNCIDWYLCFKDL